MNTSIFFSLLIVCLWLPIGAFGNSDVLIPCRSSKLNGNTSIKSYDRAAPWIIGNPSVLSKLKKYISSKGPDLLNSNVSDIFEYCPTYVMFDRNQKIDFWANLMLAMVHKESGNDANMCVQEQQVFRHGKKVKSTGLLQLSYGTAKDRGCTVTSERSLYDPSNNLMCGVVILNRLIRKGKSITRYNSSAGAWGGGSSYFAVLRNNAVNQSSNDYIRNYVASSVPGCGTREAAVPRKPGRKPVRPPIPGLKPTTSQ